MKEPKYEPTIALHDCDSLLYRAGFASQRTQYYWEDKYGNNVSGMLSSAKLAKDWFEEEELLEFCTDDLVRKSFVEVLSERVGCKKLDTFMKDYRKMVGKTVQTHEFWLTPKGDKRKAFKGIEKQYQKGREGSVKPDNYAAILEYCLTLPEIKIARKGYEADQVIVNKGQALGAKAVSTSIDKDMLIAENTWVVPVDKESGWGKPQWNTELGWVEVKKMKSSNKGIGGGFLFLMYQAMAGDTADGFFGCKGIGVVKAVELIKDCKSKQEAIDVAVELYKKVYGEYYEYTSWDGQDIRLHHTELLEQHIRMPFMQYWEKGRENEFYINEYL